MGGRQRWRDGMRKHYNSQYTDQAARRHNSVGWECVHVAVDDYSRLAYAEVLTDETASTAAGFLKRAVAYQRHGITVERVLTDNGSAYRSMIHAVACRKLGIRHLRSRPYRPQNKRQEERFHPHDAQRLTARQHDLHARSQERNTSLLTAGSGTTTIDADTQHSATNPRSAEPTCLGPTPRSARVSRVLIQVRTCGSICVWGSGFAVTSVLTAGSRAGLRMDGPISGVRTAERSAIHCRF